MARLTRKELKTDKFALEVGHTVDFFEEHRKEIVRYGTIAAAVVLVLVAIYFWRAQAQTARQQELANAIQMQEAPVGPAGPGTPVSYPTEEAKNKATTSAFGKIVSEHSGSDEAMIAEYYLGSLAADQGNLAEARKHFELVSQKGNKNYASLAKLSLAQIDFAAGKASEGEQLLRALIANPTEFVSKDQATIALARQLMATRPEEARKLLEPLRTSRNSGVSQLAIQLVSEIPAR